MDFMSHGPLLKEITYSQITVSILVNSITLKLQSQSLSTSSLCKVILTGDSLPSAFFGACEGGSGEEGWGLGRSYSGNQMASYVTKSLSSSGVLDSVAQLIGASSRTRGVQPAANRPHAAQDGCECGPTQNHTFAQNIMRSFCDYVSQSISCVAQNNSSSSSVEQRLQKIRYPCWAYTKIWGLPSPVGAHS